MRLSMLVAPACAGMIVTLAAFGGERGACLAAMVEPEAIVPELVAEGRVSTPDDEFGGGPSPDGIIFYFNKTAPPHYLYVLCQSRLVNGRWSPPEVLPFSGRYRDTDGVISPDGSGLLFASDRPIAEKDEHRFAIWRKRRPMAGTNRSCCRVRSMSRAARSSRRKLATGISTSRRRAKPVVTTPFGPGSRMVSIRPPRTLGPA